MALSRAKYRRVPDLYTDGTELELMDGNVLWLQVLNPFQRDEAQHDAQVARSRLVMALKGDSGSDERLKIRAAFLADGREHAIERLVDALVGKKLLDILNELRDDPEWKERLEIAERQDELLARPPSDPERKLLEQINRDYVTEVAQRQQAERDYQQQRLNGLTDDQLVEEYVDIYIDGRGGDLANAEYTLTEIWYGTRVCDGVKSDDGTWDHSRCEGHQMTLWETKAEVREQPESLQQLLTEAFRSLTMTVRDARFSARQGSSSQSSPLPSEPVASTASTPTATPVGAHGR